MSHQIFFNGSKKVNFDFDNIPDSADVFLEEKKTSLVFTKEKPMTKWLNSQGFSMYYKQGLIAINKGKKKLLPKAENQLEKTIKGEEKKNRNKIKVFMRKNNVDVENPKSVRDFFENYDPTIGPHPLSIILYDGGRFTGSWRYLIRGMNIPVLGWIGFNDKTSSIRSFAQTTILCRNTWYGGTKYWLFAYPYKEQDFTNLWYNNRASSIISV